MISQHRLARYLALKATADEATKAVAEAREDILAEHQAITIDGNPIFEPGIYRAKVEVRESRSFSYDAIVDLVGRPRADGMKAQLPVKYATFLTVSGPPEG